MSQALLKHDRSIKHLVFTVPIYVSAMLRLFQLTKFYDTRGGRPASLWGERGEDDEERGGADESFSEVVLNQHTLKEGAPRDFFPQCRVSKPDKSGVSQNGQDRTWWSKICPKAVPKFVLRFCPRHFVLMFFDDRG